MEDSGSAGHTDNVFNAQSRHGSHGINHSGEVMSFVGMELLRATISILRQFVLGVHRRVQALHRLGFHFLQPQMQRSFYGLELDAGC